MSTTSSALAQLSEQLALADELSAGWKHMLDPQDLPGRYGRVIRAVDHVLGAIACEAVVGGGWAVWRHGVIHRVTRDIDVVLPALRIDEFIQAASVSGFEVLPRAAGCWPKMFHRESGVEVDILPEGERPGVPPDFAPTTIPSPMQLGASGTTLSYVNLPSLIELKLAAGRLKDKADVVELIRVNGPQLDTIRHHLAGVHAQYAAEFENLIAEARKDDIPR